MQSQTEITVDVNKQQENCVSQMDPQQVGTEVKASNEATPTMSTSQLELSQKIIMASVVQSTDKSTITETEETATVYRKKLPQVMWSNSLRQPPGKTIHKILCKFCPEERLGGASTFIWRPLVQRPKQTPC